MSGTGTNSLSAPSQLSTISGDQPLGNTMDGQPVMPSFYFLQFLQRILSYIGQPVGNSGVTLTTTAVEALASAQEALTQVTNIQQSSLTIQAQLATGVPLNVPLPAAPNNCLTQGQVLARMTFTGGCW